jgi:ring-1,2-phenylacetyl-CoA epoxidase subunit PaaC
LSQEKLQTAINEIWMFSYELFEMAEEDEILIQKGIVFNLEDIKPQWLALVNSILFEADIEIPNVDYMQTGSRKGIHTEYLGHLLTEMQYLQRAYPDATW